jgi:hypothetical protein
MSTPDPDEDAEAIRRVLPELRVFDRYEQRAWLQRNRAVTKMQMVALLRKVNY